MKGLVTINAIIFADRECGPLSAAANGSSPALLSLLDVPVLDNLIDSLKDAAIFAPHVILEKGAVINPEGNAQYHFTRKPFINSDDYIIMKGNILTDLDFSKFIDFHRSSDSEVSFFAGNNRTAPYPIFIISMKVFAQYASREENILDFGKLISYAAGFSPAEYKSFDYFKEINSRKAYTDAIRDILDRKVCADKFSPKKGVILGKNSLIEVGALINPPVYVGNGTVVEAGARLGPYAAIGEHSFISRGAEIADSVLDKGVFIGESVKADGTVINSSAKIKNGAQLCRDSLIGRGSRIGTGSVIEEGITVIGSVCDNSVVTDHIIYRNSVPDELSLKSKTRLKIGTDFTYEDFLRLGYTLKNAFGQGKYALASDGSPAAEAVKNIISAGISVMGGMVYDFKESLLPVFRSGILFYKTAGGAYISSGDGELTLELSGSNGCPLGEKHTARVNKFMKSPLFAPPSEKYITSPINLENYKNYYYKYMLSGFRHRSINRFLYFNSPNKPAKEYINHLSASLGIKAVELKEKALKHGEATLIVSDNANSIIIFNEDGEIIKKDCLYMLKLLVLIGNRILKPVVLPKSVSSKVVKFAEENNLRVQICEDNALLNEISAISNNEQFMLFSDEIYGFMKILEFVSFNGTTIAEIMDNLPKIFKATDNVKITGKNPNQIFEALLNGKQQTVEKHGSYLKIYKDKNSWVMISALPDSFSYSVTAEGYSEEYAHELCRMYVKKLTGK